MKSLPFFFLTIFCTTFCFYAFPQNANIKFEHLDINSGLSQNHVMCILQDSRGFMWFGTRDGLNKYDGYKFTVYKNNSKDSNTISNNFISGILEDSRGIIWVATRGGGLNRYDKEKNNFTRFKNNLHNLNSLSSDLIISLSKDHEDNLWICTENGINYFEPAKKNFERYDYNAKCVFEDSRQNIWVGGLQTGLHLINKKSKTIYNSPYNEKDTALITTDDVAVIFEDSERGLWVGTIGNGLYAFNKTTGKYRHFKRDPNNAGSLPGDVVFAIGENISGDIWIGTENGGLATYNSTNGIFSTYQHDDIDNRSISHNSVYSIYKDVNKNMWVGTFSGGVNLYNVNANTFVHYKHNSGKNCLSNNIVLCMLESKNKKIWIGTDGGGLDLFDPVTKIFSHYKHGEANTKSICSNYVLSVLEDSRGNIWVGTWAGGITIFNPTKNTFTHLRNNPKDTSSLSSNNAWMIFEDGEKNIWVAAYLGGLNLYNPSNNTFTHFSDNSGNISTKKIFSITEDSRGNLWLSTDGGGLQMFNKHTKIFTTYIHSDDENSISDNRVTYTYEDEQGNFWISTMAGLNYFDVKKRVFKTYTTLDGLPNDLIFGLMKDAKGYLWISTNHGLSRLDPKTKKFKNYGLEDGLQSFEFKMQAFCKSASGAMYFGGINGFNTFFPDKIVPNSFEPPLVLTNFQVFNKDVPIAGYNQPSPLKKEISETREITLPYENSVFSFEFASLNYTVTEKKRYAYKLEGFDKNWNEIGTNRTATYTNLDPGKYTFKVKGLNNEGNWSSLITSVKVIITPPFWLTWWFRSLVIISILSICIVLYRSRVNRMNAQKIKLQQQVTEQTLQLIKSTNEEQKARKQAEQANRGLEIKNKEMEQFAYIASHDLQEPLRTTSGFVQLLQKQYKGKLDDRADKYFSYVLEASDRMKMLIKNLLDFSRIGSKKELEQVDCEGILHNVLADLGAVIDETGALITHDPLPVITGYSSELKQLFQNLITNAIKFRKKEISPEINISVQHSHGDWQFAFTDNGIGIEEKHNEKIFVIFQRLHTQKEYEGSGIGLSHCKKIVELHKGRIWVKSTPGKGSTFYFALAGDNISFAGKSLPEAKVAPYMEIQD